MAIETTPELLLKLLDDDKMTLFVVQDGRIMLRSKEGGLRTLALLVKEKPELVKGGIVVDKVVGVAAAVLLSDLGPKQVVASVMSLGARDRLAKEEIAPHARELVEMILDEKQESMLPLEAKAVGGMKVPAMLSAILDAT